MVAQKIVGIIPARLASTRFPGKILFPFFNHPMIEHVRRRTALAKGLDDVYVATCDDEIAEVISGYGGKVIMTGHHHPNGTTRIAEAVATIDCSHIILAQGDEPLLLPEMIEQMIEAIKNNPDGDAWNGTAPLEAAEELDRHSFVKCAVGANHNILYCFRRSPSIASFDDQQQYMRKMLGLIAFRRDFLEQLPLMPSPLSEQTESIEQMRIIANNHRLTSVPFEYSLPSVNEPDEVNQVHDCFAANKLQRAVLEEIFPNLL